MKILYNSEMKKLSRKLRNNATKSEIRLWTYLKGKQLMGYDFHRQKPVSNYIVDFFCNKLKLAIELDGYTHSFEDVFEKDERKEHSLNELGIMVLRYKDDDVMNNIEGVLEDIKSYIRGLENKHTPQSPLNRGEVRGEQSPLNRGEVRGEQSPLNRGEVRGEQSPLNRGEINFTYPLEMRKNHRR